MRARQNNASRLAEILTPPNATPEERAEIAAWTKKNQGVLATEQRRKAAEAAWNAKVVPFGPQHDDGKLPRLTGGQKQYRGRQQIPTEVGAASLRRLPEFSRLGPQLGTMRAAEGESWSAVGRTRRAWDQAAFTAGAAVIYERVRMFYGEVRSKFVGTAELDAAIRQWPRYGRKEWIADYQRHGIGLELAAAMARCAPPSNLRRIVGLAGKILSGIGPPLDLEPERGPRRSGRLPPSETDSPTESRVKVDLVIAGHSIVRAFGTASKTRTVDLLDQELVATIYGKARHRGGVAAAAEATTGRIVGRSARTVGSLVRQARRLRLIPPYYCAD